MLYPTLWPEGFNPDGPFPTAAATIVDGTNPAADRRELHSHVTGQLSLTVKGLAGIELADKLWIAPVSSGVWIPPKVPHNGVLSRTSSTIYFHLSPEVCDRLPKAPTRFLINTMTSAIIHHLAEHDVPAEHAENLGKVVVTELSIAQQLPLNSAPFPQDERLQKIAQSCIEKENLFLANAQWAESIAVSERTLTRLTKNETGLSFKDWLVSVRLLNSVSLLSQGMTVEEAAWNSGYETPSSFIRVFRAQFGMTPGAFREQSSSAV